MLTAVFSTHGDIPLGWCQQSVEMLHQGSFSAAVVSQNRDKLALPDIQADAVDCFVPIGIHMRQILNLQDSIAIAILTFPITGKKFIIFISVDFEPLL